MKKLADLYNRLEENVLLISLVVTVTIIFYQVVMRFVFNNSPSWSEEIARYLFIWQIWLGTSLALKDHRHIRVELIETAFIKRGKFRHKNVLFLLIMILWVSFTAFLTISGFQLIGELMARGALSPAVRIPLAYAYLSVPVGCLAVSVRLIHQIVLEFKKLLNGGMA